MYRVAAIATGCGALTALLISQSDRFKAYATSFQKIPTDSSSLGSKWNSNWDHRQPTAKPGEEVSKPTAKRTLLLIRHGQYETWHEDRSKRILTALGREQAQLTGQRLKDLSKDYTLLTSSSMPRAKETAQLIAECLPQVPREQSDLLTEGAPIPPEPPSKHWRPDEYVRLSVCTSIQSSINSVFLSLRSFIEMVPGLRLPSECSSIEPSPHRRRTLWRLLCVMPMSYVTLS